MYIVSGLLYHCTYLILCSATQFPFPLIAATYDSARNFLSYRKYRPRPDVAFLKHGFPRFLAEIDSIDNQNDKYRLQVQMACALRLAHALQKVSDISNEQLFLMGAFFSKDLKVDRFFFHVEKGQVRLNTII